jgi:hypothetical protein
MALDANAKPHFVECKQKPFTLSVVLLNVMALKNVLKASI